uniref:NmrA-like domain-containing protein n=1 Tax=Vannella robusta TaxID=1487602 RepID=A0A7S4I9R8_9EUKA
MVQTVCVIGAAGQVGKPFVDELLEMKHRVKLIARHSKPIYTSFEERGAELFVMEDLADVEAITKVLEGCDAVVCTVPGNDEVITKLEPIWLQAAVNAKVSRFVPTEFGCHTHALKYGDGVLFDKKKNFQQKMFDSGLGWTLVYTGGFHDYFLPNLRFFDKITTFGDKDIPIYSHSVEDVGRITARVVTDPRTMNKCVQINYCSLSQNEMLSMLKKHHGDDFEFEHFDSDTIIRLKEQAGDGISAKKGAESDRERWGINYVIYVLGKLASFTDDTLTATELYPDFVPKTPEAAISDATFVFPDNK